MTYLETIITYISACEKIGEIICLYSNANAPKNTRKRATEIWGKITQNAPRQLFDVEEPPATRLNSNGNGPKKPTEASHGRLGPKTRILISHTHPHHSSSMTEE